MAKKMNGTVSQLKVQNIVQNGNIVESDQDKANIFFAESFAKISSRGLMKIIQTLFVLINRA